MKGNAILEENEAAVNIDELPMAFILLDLTQTRVRVTGANSVFYETIGYSAEEYAALEENRFGVRLMDEEYAEELFRLVWERLFRADSFLLNLELTVKGGKRRGFRAVLRKLCGDGQVYHANCILEGSDEIGAAFHGYLREMDRLNTVVSISADSIFEYSSSDKTFSLFSNSNGRFSGKRVLNDDFEQVMKESKLIYEDDLDTFEQLCDNISGGIDRTAFELRFLENGEYRWHRVKMKTIRDETDPEAFKVIGKSEDVNDMKNAEQRLIDRAERDPLTKIYNKGTTKKLIKNYLRIDSRDTFDAFIIIDVDNFKQINDTNGHLFGDGFLVELSRKMQDLFRSNDVVGRIGGDEFIVFLRGLKQIAHIEKKVKEICGIFDQLGSDKREMSFSGSLGIALFPRDGDAFDELYKRADIALYISKRAGKNCYTFYDKEKDVSELPALPRVEQYRSNMDFLKPNADFEASIIRYAFELSENRIDDETVRALFKKVGKHFCLGRITVYGSDGQGGFTALRQWRGKNISPTVGEAVCGSAEEWTAFSQSFDRNGLLGIENVGTEQGAFFRFLSERGVKSCIAAGRFSEERLIGLVVFEECASARLWSIEEASAVNALKQLYFSYFSRILDDRSE